MTPIDRPDLEDLATHRPDYPSPSWTLQALASEAPLDELEVLAQRAVPEAEWTAYLQRLVTKDIRSLARNRQLVDWAAERGAELPRGLAKALQDAQEALAIAWKRQAFEDIVRVAQDHGLPRGDMAATCQRLASAKEVPSFYKDVVRQRLAAVQCLLPADADWTWLPPPTEPVMQVRLLHLGPDAVALGTIEDKTFRWTWPGGRAECRLEDPSLQWELPGIGRLTTKLNVQRMPLEHAIELATDRVLALHADSHAQALPMAMRLARSLHQGAHRAVLEEAHRALMPTDWDGELSARSTKAVSLPPAVLLSMVEQVQQTDHTFAVRGVLATRLALEQLAVELDSDDLFDELDRTDDQLAGLGTALSWLADDEIDDLYADFDMPVTPERWWGWSYRDNTPTLHDIDRALALPVASWFLSSDTPNTVLAANDADEPVNEVYIPILTTKLGLGGTPEGRLVWLRLAAGSGLWRRLPAFGSRASAGVRKAWSAAAALCPHGVAPREFTQHEMSFMPRLKASQSVDGESLTLPLALGFLALWMGRRGALEIYCTGAMRPAPSGTDWLTVPVLGLELKQHCVPPTAPFIVPANANPDTVYPPAAHPVATLTQAAAASGLDLSGLRDIELDLPVGRAAAELEKLCRAVRDQSVARNPPVHSGASPWIEHALRIERFVSYIEGSGAPEAVQFRAQHAKTYALLARMNGGELPVPHQLEAVREAIDSISVDVYKTELNTLWATLLLAAGLRHDPSADNLRHCKELAEVVRQALRSPGQLGRWTQGIALGTLGRWLYFQLGTAGAEEAIAHINSSIAVWNKPAIDGPDLSDEVPRSLVYLAQAHRVLGQDTQALAALCRAEELVLGTLQVQNPTYAATTRMFIDIGLGFTHLRLGSVDKAKTCIERAHSARAALGWYELPVIPMLLACVARINNQPTEHHVDQIRRALRQAGEAGRPTQRIALFLTAASGESDVPPF